MTFWVADWLRAFALTLSFEIPVAVLLLRPIEPRLSRRIALIVVANLATHPLVWFLFPGIAAGRGVRLVASEVWAVAAELAIYRLVWPPLSLRRAALASLAANAASLAAAFALTRILAPR